MRQHVGTRAGCIHHVLKLAVRIILVVEGIGRLLLPSACHPTVVGVCKAVLPGQGGDGVTVHHIHDGGDGVSPVHIGYHQGNCVNPRLCIYHRPAAYSRRSLVQQGRMPRVHHAAVHTLGHGGNIVHAVAHMGNGGCLQMGKRSLLKTERHIVHPGILAPCARDDEVHFHIPSTPRVEGYMLSGIVCHVVVERQQCRPHATVHRAVDGTWHNANLHMWGSHKLLRPIVPREDDAVRIGQEKHWRHHVFVGGVFRR